jgi:hypothetical protein
MRPQVIRINKARDKHVKSSGGTSLTFNYGSVILPDPINVPHAETKALMNALGFESGHFTPKLSAASAVSKVSTILHFQRTEIH